MTIPARRDQLVLRRLGVTAALDKVGIDYLFVSSLPPAVSPGGTFTYPITVESKRGRAVPRSTADRRG